MAINQSLLNTWMLNEFDIPPMAGQGDPAGGQAPMSDPSQGGGNPMNQDPSIAQQPQGMAPKPKGQEDNPDEDPMSPDMPDQKGDMDFETWRKTYMKESVKGDPEKLTDMLLQVRDSEDLQPGQKTFVNDNYNIQLARGDSSIMAASKEVRGLVKDRLDRNNPATSLVTYITEVLSQYPLLNNIFIKLDGYGAQKGDLHRKYIAALLGAVQVGIGGDVADIMYNTREGYGIYISTRFNSRWGDFFLGDWTLKEDDPERYLSEPELKRLKEGSPEEREVLRRRLVIESMAAKL